MIEYYINELLESGISYIPPWSESCEGKIPAIREPTPSVEEPETEEEVCSGMDELSLDTSDYSAAGGSMGSLQLGATATTVIRRASKLAGGEYLLRGSNLYV